MVCNYQWHCSIRLALTSTEKSTWRAHPQRSEYYAAIAQPRVIWAGTLSDVPTSFPSSALAATGTTTGNLADISAGMTLRIGTEVGKYDLGKMRVRRNATGASIIHVAGFGSGIVGWRSPTILTVVEEYSPWAKNQDYNTTASR